MISNEIRVAQEAYSARPFAVRWEDSHSALTVRFHTFDEAFAYAQAQVDRVVDEVTRKQFHSSSFYRSFIETPEGHISLVYYFFADEVSSF